MTNKNTFPPLISGASIDLLGGKQLYGNLIIDSLVIHKQEGELFFHPDQGLQGYGYDGIKYGGGTGLASWANEVPGTFRGLTTPFPENALVLLTDASVGIYDIDQDYAMWMTILRRDKGAYSNNLGDSSSWVGYNASGFTPVRLAYSEGKILVHMTGDPGSDLLGSMVLSFDFVHDKVNLIYSKFDPTFTVTPDATLGYLGNEALWISQNVKDFDSVGTLTVLPTDIFVGTGAAGTWKINGYSPSATPDTHFRVELLQYVDGVLVATNPCLTKGDGTWDSSTWTNTVVVADSRVEWAARIVRIANSFVMVTTDKGYGGARTASLPKSNNLYSLFLNSVNNYHQALALTAMVAYSGTYPEVIRALAGYLVRVQNADGTWPILTDRGLNCPIPTYKANKVTAVCSYALLYVAAHASGILATGFANDIKAAAAKGLDFLLTQGVTEGIQWGSGFLDSDGGYYGALNTTVDAEASIWTYFAMAKGFTVLGTSSYATKRDALANLGFIYPRTLVELALVAHYYAKTASGDPKVLLETYLPGLAKSDGTYQATKWAGDRDLLGGHLLALAFRRDFSTTYSWNILAQDQIRYRDLTGGWGWSRLTDGVRVWEELSVGSTAAAILANHSTHVTNFLT